MFESITIRYRADNLSGLTLGRPAEKMLFYSRVHVLVDFQSLQELLYKIGPVALNYLITRKHITVSYSDEYCAVTREERGLPEYIVRPLTYLGRKGQKPLSKRQKVERVFRNFGGSARGYRDHAKNFLRNTTRFSFTDIEVDGVRMLDAFHARATEDTYLQDSFISLLEVLAPNYLNSHPVSVTSFESEEGFNVLHNINFPSVNDEFNAQFGLPDKQHLSESRIIGLTYESELDLYFSSRYASEVALSSTSVNPGGIFPTFPERN